MNIFEKDFVVVPINENYHWYLCIICYPGMVGCHAMEDSSACNTPARQSNRRGAKDTIKVRVGVVTRLVISNVTIVGDTKYYECRA